MISRRTFVKTGLLFVPTIVRAQLPVVPLLSTPYGCPSAAALAVANTWKANCTTAGEAPTNAVVTAVANYICTCMNAGIWSKMKMVNPCAPGTNFWYVTITPILAGGGNQPWVVSGGGTNAPMANGLIQIGGLNEWRTGFNPSSQLTVNSSGVSLYGYTITGGVFAQFGVQTSTTPIYLLLDLNRTDVGNTARANLASATPVTAPFPGNGYFSVNRASSTDLRMFFANSGTAHAQIGSTETTLNSAAYPNGACDCGALFDTITSTSALQAPVTDVYSYISAHDSFSLAESLIEYNAVQTMRIAFGGGYR